MATDTVYSFNHPPAGLCGIFKSDGNDFWVDGDTKEEEKVYWHRMGVRECWNVGVDGMGVIEPDYLTISAVRFEANAL